MKRLTLVLVLCSLASPLAADALDGRYIVMTRPSAREAQVRLLQNDGVDRKIRAFQKIDGFAANLTEAEVAELRKSPYVRFVSPVVERHLLDAPMPELQPRTDTSVYQQKQTVPYGIELVRARDVWTVTRGGSNAVNVAILDTGIDYNHPELAAVYRGGYNAFTKDGNAFDDNHHGTHVAGTIAAADNNIGVVGVAPAARLWAVKVLDENGNGSDESLIAGIDWVLNKQAQGGNWIMNLSLGSNSSSAAEEDAFRRAADAGLLIIAAGGNSGVDGMDYPARYPGVLAVGAVDDQMALARFSNRGTRMDIVAPGVNVLSTVPVGTATLADVVAGETVLEAVPLQGSPRGDAEGPYVFCGFGAGKADFPDSVKDAIAVIRRGNLSFNEKVRNAKAAGARAVLILGRSTDQLDDRNSWTLIRGCNVTCDDQNADKAFDWPLTVSLLYADGEKVLARQGPIAESYRGDDYDFLNGTSMATPHVSGIAAMLWSLAPALRASDLIRVMEVSAHDLGKPGYDGFYGYGLIDALEAAKRVAPTAFGLPTQPPPPPGGRRRGVGH